MPRCLAIAAFDQLAVKACHGLSSFSKVKSRKYACSNCLYKYRYVTLRPVICYPLAAKKNLLRCPVISNTCLGYTSDTCAVRIASSSRDFSFELMISTSNTILQNTVVSLGERFFYSSWSHCRVKLGLMISKVGECVPEITVGYFQIKRHFYEGILDFAWTYLRSTLRKLSFSSDNL